MIGTSWSVFALKVALGGVPVWLTCVAKSSKRKRLRGRDTGKIFKSNQ